MKVTRFFQMILAGLLISMSPAVYGQSDDQPPTGWIRRVVAFPIRSSTLTQAELDPVWWKMREALTAQRRLLIASKQFLVQKDVFQGRGVLQPADAVLLGKLLDADTLITTELKERTLTLRVYSGIDGLSMWTKETYLSTSAALKEQLIPAATSLMRDFLSHIPYHGFVIVDPLMGAAVFNQGQRQLAKADLGSPVSAVAVGDLVQWIEIERVTTDPLLLSGARVTVIAEGEVIARDREIITIEIKRAKDIKLLKERSLVRFPSLSESLKDMGDEPKLRSVPQWAQSELKPLVKEPPASKPLVTALVAIANVAAFLLFAL